MKAMILAAGLGTRLRPLTEDRPKALVEMGGRTMLEITLARLREFGIREVIVNVHHFAQMVVDYLQAHGNFGIRVEVSREEELLDTGGGLKKAAWFFLEGDRTEEPFLLHNVDVISKIDLAKMVQFHRTQGALATLAVQDRETSRYLLWDGLGRLCGRRAGRDGTAEMVREVGAVKALAFSGIHVISPQLLREMREEGAFSIIDAYLRLAQRGGKICGFPADGYYWRDLGKAESVREVEQDMREGV